MRSVCLPVLLCRCSVQRAGRRHVLDRQHHLRFAQTPLLGNRTCRARGCFGPNAFSFRRWANHTIEPRSVNPCSRLPSDQVSLRLHNVSWHQVRKTSQPPSGRLPPRISVFPRVRVEAWPPHQPQRHGVRNRVLYCSSRDMIGIKKLAEEQGRINRHKPSQTSSRRVLVRMVAGQVQAACRYRREVRAGRVRNKQIPVAGHCVKRISCDVELAAIICRHQITRPSVYSNISQGRPDVSAPFASDESSANVTHDIRSEAWGPRPSVPSLPDLLGCQPRSACTPANSRSARTACQETSPDARTHLLAVLQSCQQPDATIGQLRQLSH